MSTRALVINRRGVVREVAASAVPVLAPGGWRLLTDAELVTHQQRKASERAAREESLTPGSGRRPAAQAAAAPAVADPSAPSTPAEGEIGASAPKRSGAKRRQDDTDTETKES